MKLAVVIPVLNQFPIANQAIKFLLESTGYDIYVVDNGSDVEFEHPNERVKVFRSESVLGSYPVFFEALKITDEDVLAFFHSDFFVRDKEWATKVLAEFEARPKLGMIGFIGSNEIDARGGRGLGTASNFQGLTTVAGPGQIWSGSPAAAHGKVITGFINAAVVDGCSMILRRTALEQIGQRKDFPPHHFYDRLISTQLLENGWAIGVLGIACDHISGQTANQEKKYHDMAKAWAEAHNVAPSVLGVNWDVVIYQEAERQWLKEYRDEKHFIPIKVNDA